jgi:uncharacterized protein with ATP-grasp and redox domains
VKINLDCIPCIQRQALESLKRNTQDVKLQEKVLRKVVETLIKADWSSTPLELSNKVHKIVREKTGIQDPYEKIKKMYNDFALDLYPKIKEMVNKSSDSLNTAIRVAIAGNIIDFGAKSKGDFDVEKTIEDVLNKEFAIDDYRSFEEKIRKVRSLLYFLDNAGETVFDKLLIENILKFREKTGIDQDLKITLVVKGGPVINDATLKDAKYIGIDRVPNVRFEMTSNGDSNTGPKLNSKEVESWIKDHDITVAKGQANYEGLSQFNDIFFLLIAKCRIIASDLGVKEGDIVLKYKK